MKQKNKPVLHPVLPDADELKNPYLAITRFFDADHLPGHLEILAYWKKLVIRPQYYNRQNCPADLLFMYKITSVLMEAAYMLRKVKGKSVAGKMGGLSEDDYFLNECNQWRDFPQNIGRKSLLNPYRVFRKFFKAYSLVEYREHLYNWLSHGLSPHAASYMNAADLIAVYENLQKLFEAAWIIHEREIAK